MAYGRKRSTFRRAKPYARKTVRKTPKAHFVSGGVGGAAAYMAPGMQLPQEVKYKDTPFVAPGVAQTGAWSIVCSNALHTIRQSAGNSGRIGRSIRIVGMVLRAAIVTNSGSNAAPVPNPYTMDFIWDRQCNGDLATVQQIYTGTERYQLPNPLYESRFKFIKRVERDATLQQAWTTANVNIKCNKVVEFDADTGAITDLSGTNLIITMSSSAALPVITGMVVRVLYVDA